MSNKLGEPWCSQHECHPEICWEQHQLLPQTNALTRQELTTKAQTDHAYYQEHGRVKEEG